MVNSDPNSLKKKFVNLYSIYEPQGSKKLNLFEEI